MSLKTLYRKRTVIWPFTTQLYGLYQDKATKIQELLEKDRNSRISNVRRKYNIQENIDIYEKYINEMI